MRTCCENELGCSNSGSGVSDVQADELIKPFTSTDKINNEQKSNVNLKLFLKEPQITKKISNDILEKKIIKVSLVVIMDVSEKHEH